MLKRSFENRTIHILIVSLCLFINYSLLAQFELNRLPDPFLSIEDAENPYPRLAYFNHLGDSYSVVYKFSKNGRDTLLSSYYKCHYTRNQNKIRVKSTTNGINLPSITKFKIVDGEIKACNRFWKEKKGPSYFVLNKTQVNPNDSIVDDCTYIIMGKDTILSHSNRYVYDRKGYLQKQEFARRFYATTDSTWKLAEKEASTFEQITYTYKGNKDKDTVEIKHDKKERLDKYAKERKYMHLSDYSITSETYTLCFLYDSNGNVIKYTEMNNTNSKLSSQYKFTYKDGFTIITEEYFNGEIFSRTYLLKE